ncbi:hypothetical protein CP533_3929 [Ophiocordyceps camponoti-saundersi (nom. inval.)]|nr:hypothetical protein CP533_3929 [Ophiocordyceps camponoti-saundersi (nom. inval.)]
MPILLPPPAHHRRKREEEEQDDLSPHPKLVSPCSIAEPFILHRLLLRLVHGWPPAASFFHLPQLQPPSSRQNSISNAKLQTNAVRPPSAKPLSNDAVTNRSWMSTAIVQVCRHLKTPLSFTKIGSRDCRASGLHVSSTLLSPSICELKANRAAQATVHRRPGRSAACCAHMSSRHHVGFPQKTEEKNQEMKKAREGEITMLFPHGPLSSRCLSLLRKVLASSSFFAKPLETWLTKQGLSIMSST